jgi:hypothetical protein
MEKMKNWQLMQALNIAKNIINSGQELVPMIIGYTDKGHILFPGLYKSDEEKEAYLKMVKTCFLIYQVNYYISISEAWMSSNTSIRPSQDPDKKDILLAMCISHNEKRTVTYEIKEVSSKKELIEFNNSLTNVGGTFAELLPPKGVVMPEETRQALMKKMEELGLLVKPNTDEDLPPNSTIN